MNSEYKLKTHSYYSYDVVGQSIMDINDTLKTSDKKILEFMRELYKEKLINRKERVRRFSI